MAEAFRSHRKLAFPAVFLVVAAITGTFLPWVRVEFGEGPAWNDFAVGGAWTGSGLVVVFLVAGLGGLLASLLLDPAAIRPPVLLLLAALATASGIVLAGVNTVGPFASDLPTRVHLHVGWWLTISTGSAALVLTVFALAAASRDARLGWVEPGTFD